jgi:hypothetical protein
VQLLTLPRGLFGVLVAGAAAIAIGVTLHALRLRPPTTPEPKPKPVVARKLELCVFPQVDSKRALELAMAPTYTPIGLPDRLWMEIPDLTPASAPKRSTLDRATQLCLAMIDELSVRDLGRSDVDLWVRDTRKLTDVALAMGGECRRRAEEIVTRFAWEDHRPSMCGLSPSPDAVPEWRMVAELATTVEHRRIALYNIAFKLWDRARYADYDGWADAAIALEQAAAINPSEGEQLRELAVDAWDNAVRAARDGVTCTTREDLERIAAGLRRAPAGTYADLHAKLVLAFLPQ